MILTVIKNKALTKSNITTKFNFILPNVRKPISKNRISDRKDKLNNNIISPEFKTMNKKLKN